MVWASADYVTEALTDSEDGNNVDLNPNLLATVSAPVSKRYRTPFRAAWAWLPVVPVLCVVAFLIWAVFAWAQPEIAPEGPNSPAHWGRDVASPLSAPPGQCLREGTKIVDRLGHFRMTGDRVTFFTADGSRHFVGLENLNLERIARAIEEDTAQLQWSVTGTVTEYRGANFLTVECAILKGQKAPPEDAVP
jgi:hypothetical protein